MPQASPQPTQPHPAWVGFFDEIMRLDAEITARRAIRRLRHQDSRRFTTATILAASTSRLVFPISLGTADSREMALRRCLIDSSPRLTRLDNCVIKFDHVIGLKRTG